MGYKKTAFVGITWVGVLRGMLRASSLVRTAFLAHLLTPEQFGLFGIAAIVLGLTEMMTETGVNVVLIQNQTKEWDRYLDTAWVISICRGIVISIAMLITSPLVTRFFNAPDALNVIIIISLVPFVRGFINPAIVQFQKNLRFDAEFRFRSGIIFADAATAICFALIFRSASSLAWGLLAGALTELALSLTLVHPKPRFHYSHEFAKMIIHQGKWLTGAGIFAYFAQKLPDIFIGRLLGTTELGYFQMAYRFAVVPLEEIIETVNRVAFPLYSQLYNQLDKIKKGLFKNAQAFLIISGLWSVCLILFAEPFTRLVLGAQWLPIIPTLRTLSLAGFMFALSAPPEPVLLAVKAQHKLMYMTLLRLILILIFIQPAITLAGTVGVAAAISAALVIVLPVKWWLTLKLFTPSPAQSTPNA